MNSKRLFLALWPDDKVRDEIASICKELSPDTGRIIPASDIHITLVFLGSISQVQIDSLVFATDKIHAESFSLKIDLSGWWKKPKILWLAPDFIPESLFSLVRDIKKLANDQKISLELRPYTPHITIARDVSRNINTDEFQPIHWYCRDFCLVESVSTNKRVEYRILRRWPLTSI